MELDTLGQLEVKDLLQARTSPNLESLMELIPRVMNKLFDCLREGSSFLNCLFK
jgi:hypothetical protein